MRSISIFNVFLKQQSLALLHKTNGSTTFSPAALKKKAIVSHALDFLPPLALLSFFSAKPFSGSALKKEPFFIHIPDIEGFIIPF